MVILVGKPKYAKRPVALTEFHLGMWVSFRGNVYKVVAASMLMDDPYIHIMPPGDDWDKVIEVYGRDLRFIFPAKVKPKDE